MINELKNQGSHKTKLPRKHKSLLQLRKKFHDLCITQCLEVKPQHNQQNMHGEYCKSLKTFHRTSNRHYARFGEMYVAYQNVCIS